MASYSLFMNGVYREVLDDTCSIHRHLPEQILYLQAYASQLIVRLADDEPSVESPVRMFISTTKELAKVRYACEIVGDVKATIDSEKRSITDNIIRAFLPTETVAINS